MGPIRKRKSKEIKDFTVKWCLVFVGEWMNLLMQSSWPSVQVVGGGRRMMDPLRPYLPWVSLSKVVQEEPGGGIHWWSTLQAALLKASAQTFVFPIKKNKKDAQMDGELSALKADAWSRSPELHLTHQRALCTPPRTVDLEDKQTGNKWKMRPNNVFI